MSHFKCVDNVTDSAVDKIVKCFMPLSSTFRCNGAIFCVLHGGSITFEFVNEVLESDPSNKSY